MTQSDLYGWSDTKTKAEQAVFSLFGIGNTWAFYDDEGIMRTYTDYDEAIAAACLMLKDETK